MVEQHSILALRLHSLMWISVMGQQQQQEVTFRKVGGLEKAPEALGSRLPRTVS
jgi:ATP-dependent 26S proteasome regulatory subunit